MEMLNCHSRLVSPEIEVPMIIKGLSNIYGKDSVVNVIKNAFNVRSLNKFLKDPALFRSLSAFHKSAVFSELRHIHRQNSQEGIISKNGCDNAL